MYRILSSRVMTKVLCLALTVLFVFLSVFLVGDAKSALAQGGAPDSTIMLQMPFIAGETWTVGGAGSFYGEGAHTNARNDYYATDWNRANDLGAALLPVADGHVSEVAIPNPDCPNTPIGCYVQIDHANGYKTKYGHMSAVSVTVGASVRTSTLIGRVGNSGTNTTGPHLHLTFRHFDNGGYFSKCWNNGQTCPNGEDAEQPQGHRPSPMMTTLGPTTLVDGGTYTSVNGRVYLPDLPNNNNWNTDFYVRNDGTETRTVWIYYFNADGTPTPPAVMPAP